MSTLLFNSIWETPEVDAWSRNFSYDEYLRLHTRSGSLGRPFTLDAYDAFGMVLDQMMEDDLK